MPRTKMGKYHQVGFRLATPLWDECRKIAEEEYWDTSQVIKEAIKLYLEHRKNK